MEEKGLDEASADAIGVYVRENGKMELVEKLLSDAKLTCTKTGKQGLEGIKTLLEYASIFNLDQVVSFDLSLARGLDYYTGIIYEAVLLGL